jgi:hypothetical protein
MATDLIHRSNTAVATLLDAAGLCSLIDQSNVMDPVEFPNTVRAAINSIQRSVHEAIQILEGKE